MATPSVAASVFKLAIAGEQAGFTIDQMIDLLNAGVTVDTLVGLIELRSSTPSVQASELRSSRWVM
jgi:hypothetical protein